MPHDPHTSRSASSRSAGSARSARTCTCSSTATTSSSSTAGSCSPTRRCSASTSSSPTSRTSRSASANVKAFLITHAHEDHVGALPYVLPEFPGVPVYASTLARGLLGNKIKEHKLHNNPLLALEPGDELQIGPFGVVAVPGRPLDPGRDGHRPPDAGRRRRPHRRLQVRPHPGRRQAVRLRDPREARRRGRHLPPVRLDPGREPRLHAVGADRRRGLPRDHGAARRAGHRGDVREQHRPRPAGPRRRRLVRAQGRRSSAGRWSRTSGSRPTSAT